MTANRELLPDDARFDRLVDGELSAAEYKSFLLSLEREPDGWRRLALVFLEAQAWKREMGQLRHSGDLNCTDSNSDSNSESNTASLTDSVSPDADPSSTSKMHWSKFLSLAACLLMMFAFGVAFDRGLVGGWTPPRASGPTSANKPNLSERANGMTPALSANPQAPVTVDDGALDPRLPLGNVNLVMERDGEESTEMVVPVYRGDEKDLNPLKYASMLPPQVLNSLERQGHTVRRQQEFLPFDLENGQRTIVPVERLEIVPVSRRPY